MLKKSLSELNYYWSQKKLLKSTEVNMLQVFQRHKCLFIHIPKNGGISVSKSLFGDINWGHRDVNYYRKVFGSTNFNQFYKFTFVRNPYDRVYSAYKFLKNGGINDQDLEFSNTILKEYESFDQFIREGLKRKEVLEWVHFKPQSDYLLDRKNNLSVDFVGKFERLSEDFQHVASKLSIDAELKHLNKTRIKADIIEQKNINELKQIVREVYNLDYDLFNYEI